MADHLFRMQIQGSDLPIDDYMRNDTLLMVTMSCPWYANLVNFMMIGYIPTGQYKKRLIHLNKFHLWDEPYLFKVCAHGLLRRCIPLCETRKIRERCHSSPYGGNYGAFNDLERFGRVDSFGQTCMEMLKNLSGIAQDVRSTGTSIPEMLCP